MIPKTKPNTPPINPTIIPKIPPPIPMQTGTARRSKKPKTKKEQPLTIVFIFQAFDKNRSVF
jgi:hypothetical protein